MTTEQLDEWARRCRGRVRAGDSDVVLHAGRENWTLFLALANEQRITLLVARIREQDARVGSTPSLFDHSQAG
jgi:hypothetical protein